MKFKKRKKFSRMRRSRTCGYGSRKKHRGKGSKGGKGMAGTGKMADQKKTWVLKYKKDYFGKKSLKPKKKKIFVINLREIQDNIESLIKKGIAKRKNNGYELELKNYKILSLGNLKIKIFVKALDASKKAIEKIKKAGGNFEKINKKNGKTKKRKKED